MYRFLATTSNSLWLAGCPTIQRNSDTTWTKHPVPQIKGSVLQDPLLRFAGFATAALQKLEKQFTYIFCLLYKDMIKDTDEHPDGKIHRARSGRVQCRRFCPWRDGGVLPPSCDVFTNLEVLWTLYCWDFMKASSHRHDQIWTPFPSSLPPLEKLRGLGMRLKIPSSSYGLFFLVPASIQGPSRSPHSESSQ